MINSWVQGICTGAWDSRSLWHYDDFVVFVHHSFDKQQHKWTSYRQSLVTVTTWIADSFSVHQEFLWSLCTHLQALKAQEGTGLRWEEYILQQNVSIYSITMHASVTTNTIYFTWGQFVLCWKYHLLLPCPERPEAPMLFGSTSYPSLPHQEKHMSWKTLPLKLWTLGPGKCMKSNTEHLKCWKNKTCKAKKVLIPVRESVWPRNDAQTLSWSSFSTLPKISVSGSALVMLTRSKKLLHSSANIQNFKMFRVVSYAQNPALSFHHRSPQVHLNTTTERETFEGNQSDGLKSSAVKRDCTESTLFIQTWVDFLKVEQDRNAILILGHQIVSRIHHILLVVWSQDTAQTQHWDAIKSIPNNKEHMEENHSRTSVSVMIIVAVHLKESMFRTRGARGMSMNNEFVKKAIRRRASRFSGTSMADSRSVNKRWSLLICSIPWKTKSHSQQLLLMIWMVYTTSQNDIISKGITQTPYLLNPGLSAWWRKQNCGSLSLGWKQLLLFLFSGECTMTWFPCIPIKHKNQLQSITSCSLQIPKPHTHVALLWGASQCLQ